MKRIGVVTIGQSPRPDITTDFIQNLPSSVILIEAGALDGLSLKYVNEKMCPSENEVVYVSRMVDGSQVKLGKNKIIPIMQEKIRQLESKGADLVVIICTGDFPKFDAKIPLIYAGNIIKGLFSGLRFQGRVGILVPLEEQINYAHEKWSGCFNNLIVLNVSPYTSKENDFRQAARKFKDSNAGLIIMDCMGYTFAQRSIVYECSNVPVISARGAVISFLNELLRK